MAAVVGERSLHKITSSVEATHGTRVNPTIVMNFDSSGMIALDRAADEPQEDYGLISRHQPGRANYGVKLAHLPLRGVLRFEDLQGHLSCGLAGGVVPSLVSGTTYLWAFAGDDTADTIDSRTFQDITNVQGYEMSYAMVERYRFSFNALAAPVNAPWMLEVDYIGQDRINAGAAGAPVAVAGAETAMGHLTTIAFGSTATAFNALAAMAGLLQADITIQTGVTPRKWGGSSDTFDTHGRLNREGTFTLTFWEKTATKTGIWDVFAVAGTIPTDQRMRINAIGTALSSGNKNFIIDARVRFTTFAAQEVNGGTVYVVSGVFVDDATLASDVKISLNNAVATVL